MHERSMIAALIRKAEQVVAAEGATHAVAVGVRLGALSHLSPEHFAEYFDREAEGTALEGAWLDIEMADDVADPLAQDVVVTHVDVVGTA